MRKHNGLIMKRKVGWILDGDVRNAADEMQYYHEFQPSQLERIADVAEEIKRLKGEVDTQAENDYLKGLTTATAIAAVLAIAAELLKKAR